METLFFSELETIAYTPFLSFFLGVLGGGIGGFYEITE